MSDSTNSAMNPLNSGRSGTLPRIALGMTSLELGISLLLIVLVFANVVAVPWNAVFLPWAAIAGLVPYCVIALVVACVSRARHRVGRSTAAIVLGVFAVVFALAAAFLVVVASIANHPI